LTIDSASGVVLPAGNYRLTLVANGIMDNGGRSLDADVVLNFHVLPGDANGDRIVNDGDLYLVWQNLLLPPPSRDLQFDLNNDGAVTLADLDVVRANYRNSLPEAAAASELATPNEDPEVEMLAVVASAEPSPAPDSSVSKVSSQDNSLDARAVSTSLAGFWSGSLFEWRTAEESGRARAKDASHLLNLSSSSFFDWQTAADVLSPFSPGLRISMGAFGSAPAPSPFAFRTIEYSSSSPADSTIAEKTRSPKPLGHIAPT
jgi:hypothetical protein